MWSAIPKNYDIDRKNAAMRRVACRDHPLFGADAGQVDESEVPQADNASAAVTKKKEVVDDPLSAALDDPLSGMLGGGESSKTSQDTEEEDHALGNDPSLDDAWQEKRQQI